MGLTRNALVTVAVDGTPLGTWTTKTGGKLDSDEVKFRSGGMDDQVALGGPATRDNVVVSREYDTYMQTKLAFLENRVGTGSMTVTFTPLGNNKTQSGPAVTYGGILKSVSTPDADDNASEVAMIELELSVNQTANIA